MVNEAQDPVNRLIINPLKYLNSLPDFYGDSKDLQTFTTLIDRIHPHLQTYDELSQQLFSDIIKSKLKGKARQTIEINCHATSWVQIKNVLQNNFGDRRTCDELFDELRATIFRTNTLEFYSEIKDRLHRLNNKMVVILGETEAARQSTTNNMRTALNVFKNKIPEPMKTILFCRNPEDLEEAMDILFQAGYAHSHNSNNQKYYTSNYRQSNNNGVNHNNSGPHNNRIPRKNSSQNHHQNDQRYKTNPKISYNRQDMNNRYTGNSVPQRFGNNNVPDFRLRNQFQQSNIARENIPWRNNQNFQPTMQRPEPMDVNVNETSENFRDTASGNSYHI